MSSLPSEVGPGAGAQPGLAARIGIAYLLPLALLVYFRSVTAVHICDDAYISLKSALNLAHGRGLTFNPDAASYVFTNPLWVLLATVFRGVTGDMVAALRGLSITSELLLVAAMVRLSRRFSRDCSAGLLAAVLLITNSSFLLTSFMGMELPLYLLIWVVTTDFLAGRRWLPALAGAALAVWVRTEGLLLFGVAVFFWGWTERLWRRENWRRGRVLGPLGPALLILAGYFAFGQLVFGEWVPMSVQRKALTSPALFSEEWREGFRVVARGFLQALVGRHAYWYQTPTHFIYMALPLAVGLVQVWRTRDRVLLPLAGMTGLYTLSFLATGSVYAEYSPWYFAPVLPLACFLAALGCARIAAALCAGRRGRFAAGCRLALLAILALLWALAEADTLKWNADKLKKGMLGRNHRERLYATAAIWAGQHLGPEALVAANEIGAVAFYLRPSQSVLDMFGLLSTPADLGVDYVQRVARDRPELIVTLKLFFYHERLLRELGAQYRWIAYRDLRLGFRQDVAARLPESVLWDLEAVLRKVNLDREYRWESR